ncbi:MAG: phosphoribosyltransferase [Acidocella sp. 20-63-7]|nr:MAG: phosphoribosyltransferase [Acidocella sp. 20-63-7]
MKSLFAELLNTLLPPSCLACETPVAGEGQFCLSCFSAANFIAEPLCQRCGRPLPFSTVFGVARICAGCTLSPPVFAQARAALRYDETAQKLILPFKYADRAEMARGIARLMLRPGTAMLTAAEMLVPVPLHRSRLKARRYNQAALLAVALGRLAARPVSRNALLRQKPTAALEGMGLLARQTELQDAIIVRPGFAASGKRILLIDDVMTSGATANACAAALLAAGAAYVDVLTAARVADPRFE